MESSQKHFVLVHGACHGAWCWYKIKPRLESAGHRVTALDLSASGTNMTKIEEVVTMHHYTLPLLEFMEAIPTDEKVILVGHSLGGLNLALAIDKYPDKVSVAVFISAFMPDTVHAPSYVIDEFKERSEATLWLDTEFKPYSSSSGRGEGTAMLFGPKFLSTKLYQKCSEEEVALGRMLVRSGSLFVEDLSKANKFTEQGYGSCKKVYLVCNEDKAILQEFQLWMIQNQNQNNPVAKVTVAHIKTADHMPMLSHPQQLTHYLLSTLHH